MSNEIKVGEWTVTEEKIWYLGRLHSAGRNAHQWILELAASSCKTLGIDPTTDSVARDICEEIVLHGTPVEEVIAKLQRHLEGGQ